MKKYVYLFNEGNKDMRDVLGGKGANLAEMTNMGCQYLKVLLCQQKHAVIIIKMMNY